MCFKTFTNNVIWFTKRFYFTTTLLFIFISIYAIGNDNNAQVYDMMKTAVVLAIGAIAWLFKIQISTNKKVGEDIAEIKQALKDRDKECDLRHKEEKKPNRRN